MDFWLKMIIWAICPPEVYHQVRRVKIYLMAVINYNISRVSHEIIVCTLLRFCPDYDITAMYTNHADCLATLNTQPKDIS